jgi:hypothetical protein
MKVKSPPRRQGRRANRHQQIRSFDRIFPGWFSSLGALGVLAVNRSSLNNPSQALNVELPLGFNVQPTFKESIDHCRPNSRKRALAGEIGSH